MAINTAFVRINRVVLALSVARMADAVGNSMLFVALPLYVTKLPATVISVPESVRVGILISFYGFVYALAQPITAALTDRIGMRKTIIQAGQILMGMGTLAILTVHHFRDMLLIRFFQGFGLALIVPASLALMAMSTEKTSRGRAMGFYSASRQLGLGAGPLIAGVLVVSAGFNAVFYLGGFLILLSAVLVQFMVFEDVKQPTVRTGAPFRVFDRTI